MKYYEIFVASARYQKMEPLTYASELQLNIGDVVVVPLGRIEALGYMHAKVPKPKFACKLITRQILQVNLPEQNRKLFTWLQQYYPSGSGPSLQLFLPSSLLTKKAETLSDTSDKRLSKTASIIIRTKGRTGPNEP